MDELTKKRAIKLGVFGINRDGDIGDRVFVWLLNPLFIAIGVVWFGLFCGLSLAG